jgi:amidase
VTAYATAMADPELLFRPALELAALVRAGEVTARELTATALDAIATRDGALGAFVHVDAEGALAAADAIAPGDPRPFAGVPTAIKDNRAVAGWPLRHGAQLYGDYVAPEDSYLVRRLRAAGFVLVGKTALPEYGIMPTTETTRFGATRNPWDLRRTPGGSSGGAAAAVAAGLLPVAHGNDGGGSIRIPAACCGLVGLKPQRNRVSQGPAIGDSFLSGDGMLTRTVADTAAALDVLAGPEAGDAAWAPPPPEPFAATAARALGRLRIAVTAASALPGAELDPICERAWREGAALLASLGHELEEIDPPWSRGGLLELFAASFGPLIAAGIAAAGAVAEREPGAHDMEPLSWLVWQRALAMPAPRFLALQDELKRRARAALVALAPYDAVLTPALAWRPVEIGALNGALKDPDATFRRSVRFTPYTAIANCTGQPAVALPLAEGADGLPVGVQLLGRPADEGRLLALAAQVEAARPWARRRPPRG